jgi:type II secretory pathway pseudopilin PulG
MKQRGMSLIEVMVLCVIAGVIILIAIGFINDDRTVRAANSNVVQTLCISGYKVVIGRNGQPVQLLDHHGFGVQCGEFK